MRFLALAIISFVVLVSLPTEAADQSVTFSTIARGTQSGVRVRTQVVVRTSSAWQVLWRKHVARLPGASAVPKVDFSRDMVIAVFAGDVTAATRASIVNIIPHLSQLIVLVRIAETQPGPALTDSGVASPFQMVRLARSTLPVVFRPAKTRDTY
jgi:hypothetical protein